MIGPKLRFFIWVFHKRLHITQGDLERKAVIVSQVTQKARGSNTVLYWKEHSSKMLKSHGKSKTYKFYNYTSGHIHHCPIRNLEVHQKKKKKKNLEVHQHHYHNLFYRSVSDFLVLFLQYDTKYYYYYMVGVGQTEPSYGSSLLLNLVLAFPTRLLLLVIVS